MSLYELDAIIALLRARAKYWEYPQDEAAPTNFRSFLDEMLELHCTPAGVNVQTNQKWGHGVACVWLSVGALLKKSVTSWKTNE